MDDWCMAYYDLRNNFFATENLEIFFSRQFSSFFGLIRHFVVFWYKMYSVKGSLNLKSRYLLFDAWIVAYRRKSRQTKMKSDKLDPYWSIKYGDGQHESAA